MAMTKKIEDWKWDTQNIGVLGSSEEAAGTTPSELKPGDFIEGGTTLILSGPARVEDLAGLTAQLIPIGMLDNVSVSQQKNVQQIFEIGSKLAHIVPGRTMGQLQLGRVFFDGDSLMKAMYAGSNNFSITEQKLATGMTAAETSKSTSGRFAANLASSYFDQPHGLCFMFKDQSGGEVATIYFEDCMINSHQFSINAQANIIQEGASVMFRRIVPIEVTGEPSSIG